MKTVFSFFSLSSLFLCLFLTGCHSLKGSCWKKKCKFKDLKASAEIASVSGDSIKGYVQFESAGRKQVKVTAQVTGLPPHSTLGFHVHEFGDCGNKGLSAGGHFNPKRKKHGGPDDKEHHQGDLGNLKAGAKGQAFYSKVVSGKIYKFLGRSVVIHSGADDLKTQPSGGSGPRLACGVIGAVSGESDSVSVDADSAAASVSKKAGKSQAVVTKSALSLPASATIKAVKTTPVVAVKTAAPVPSAKPAVKKATVKPKAEGAKPAVKKAAVVGKKAGSAKAAATVKTATKQSAGSAKTAAVKPATKQSAGSAKTAAVKPAVKKATVKKQPAAVAKPPVKAAVKTAVQPKAKPAAAETAVKTKAKSAVKKASKPAAKKATAKKASTPAAKKSAKASKPTVKTAAKPAVQEKAPATD